MTNTISIDKFKNNEIFFALFSKIKIKFHPTTVRSGSPTIKNLKKPQSLTKILINQFMPSPFICHGQSWQVRGSPFISELFAKTSCQVMGSHGQSCQVRGIPRTKG